MNEDTTILPFRQSEMIVDPLTDLAREGARRMLAEALKAEADAFVASFANEQLEDGRQRIVRHGFGPERQIQTGIGPLDVQRPKVRDRIATADPAEKIRFTSNILPKWARRSVSLDALIPVLYLKGISTGDFQEALSAIMGPDAPNLSPSVVSRLTAGWQAEYDAWARRDLSARNYIYIWADGVYLQARMEENAECMLVILGATPEGRKELIGFQVGLRESEQSWHELLTDIKGRGLSIAPKIAVGDGAMGFWNALDRTFPGTKHQRCWVHKVKNVMNCFPKQMAQGNRVWHTARHWVAEGAEWWFSGGLFPGKERSLEHPSDHRPRVEAIAACFAEQDAARDAVPSNCGDDQRPNGQPQPSCLRARRPRSDCIDLSTAATLLPARQPS